MFQSFEIVSTNQIRRGMRMVMLDGLTTEAMITFTRGTLLVSVVLYLGGTAFHIGMLAAMPLIANFSQLVSIALNRKFVNRKAISVLFIFFSRIPFLLLGIFFLLIPGGAGLDLLNTFLWIHFLLSAIAGPVWISWMKDLIPENKLGKFFSRRTQYSLLLNIVLSLTLAYILDHVTTNRPDLINLVYGIMFITGGIAGLTGVTILIKTPEPRAAKITGKLWPHIPALLKDRNFKNLIEF